MVKRTKRFIHKLYRTYNTDGENPIEKFDYIKECYSSGGNRKCFIPKQYERLITVMNHYEVDFIITGIYAVNFYGHVRQLVREREIEMMYNYTVGNREKLALALARYESARITSDKEFVYTVPYHSAYKIRFTTNPDYINLKKNAQRTETFGKALYIISVKDLIERYTEHAQALQDICDGVYNPVIY